ncbi:MAG: hypothetical protein K0R89_451 [Ramlibacter sp.]|jgi:hypothetical protein|nr:hypothetical protein [Ramlibacter sp.]
MNTQTHVRELQAGQALALDELPQGRFVLVEGEVLLQAPATWLAGTVVQPPAVRIAAPASLPAMEVGMLRATRDAKIVVEEAPGVLAVFSAWWSRAAAVPTAAR